MLVCNSHGTEIARRLDLPLLHAGFPQYDRVGGYARGWVGYRLGRQALFDIANLFLGQHHELPAYRSIYRSEPSNAVPASLRTQTGAGVVCH